MTAEAVRASPHALRRSPLQAERLVQWSVAAIVVFLVIAPLAPILYQAVADRPLYERGIVLTLRNFANLVSDPAFATALLNSVLFAVIGTVLTQVIGGALAVVVGRTDIPGRAVISGLVVLPLYLSQLVVTTGWLIIYGPAGYVTTALKLVGADVPWDLYTIPGMALAAAVCQTPLTFLYCLAAINSADAALEDSARTAGLRPWQVFAAITLPLLRPALTISGLLNMVMLLEALSIPLILGRPANIEFLTSFIYTRGIAVSNPDYGIVAAAAVLLVTFVVSLAALQRLVLRKPERFVTVGGKATRPKRFTLGPWRWAVLAAALAYVLTMVIFPILGLVAYAFASFLTPLVPVWEVLTLDNFRHVLTTPVYMRALGNSIIIAVVGGAFATGLVTLLAVIVHRSDFPFRRVLDTLALLPRAVPGMIAGIGIFYVTALVTPLGWLRETLVLVMIAFTMRYIPLGYGAITSAAVAIDQQLDRSARVMGADWWTTMRRIVIPLLGPAMISAYTILFVHFFKDYGTAVFLSAPGSEVLGTTMLQMFVSGESGPASALATIQIVITIAAILLVRRIAKVAPHG